MSVAMPPMLAEKAIPSIKAAAKFSFSRVGGVFRRISCVID